MVASRTVIESIPVHIAKYRVGLNIKGSAKSRDRVLAEIICESSGGHTVTYRFVADGTPLPENKVAVRKLVLGERFKGEIYLPAQMFVWVLDLLRNEKGCSSVLDRRDPEASGGLITKESPAEWGHVP